MGWRATTYGVVRPPQHIFIYFFGFFFLEIFFLEKKSVGGILGTNKSNGLNCHNLKVWGGVKCHILNFGGKSKNGWILQGGKE
jgi:hypothetical protein